MATYSSVLKEVLSFDILRTWIRLVKNYKVFFSEVLEGDWSNKSKPVPFFIACLSVSLIIAGFTGSPIAKPSWVDILPELENSSVKKFEQLFFMIEENPVTKEMENEMFGLNEDTSRLRSISMLRLIGWQATLEQERNLPGSSILSGLIEEKAGNITTKSISEYLRKNGDELLALRYEKTSNIIDSKLKKLTILSGIFLPIFYVMLFKFIHTLLKTKNIKAQQTIDIMFYITSIMLSLSIIIDSISINLIKTPELSNIPQQLFVIIFTVTFFYKVIKHTHAVSFWRMIWATQVPFTIATIMSQFIVILTIELWK